MSLRSVLQLGDQSKEPKHTHPSDVKEILLLSSSEGLHVYTAQLQMELCSLCQLRPKPWINIR